MHRSIRRALAAPALLVLTACADAVTPTPPAGPIGQPLGPTLATVTCVAQVRGGVVSCGQQSAGASADRILGGQGINLRVTSSNVLYDSVSGKFAFDVTLQNLLVQQMGKLDSATITGSRIFFHSLPVATAGTGVVSVDSADGVGLFTGSSQPYYDYPGVLKYGEVSAPRRWVLTVPKTVTTFAFQLYVNTNLLPVVLFEAVRGGNRDIYRVGLDGSDLVRMTTDGLEDGDPTVAAGRVVFTSTRHGQSELYAMPLVGGAETRLTTTTGTVTEKDPSLSPDGTRIAFTRPVGGFQGVYWAHMDSIATASRRLTNASGVIEGSPTWGPNGTITFMSTYSTNADIWQRAALAVADTGATLIAGARSDVEPEWNPDRTALAFATNRDTDTEIYIYRGGVETRVTTRAGTDGNPTWLRDGRIVFVCYTGSSPYLCWLDPAAPSVVHPIPTGGTALKPSAVVF